MRFRRGITLAAAAIAGLVIGTTLVRRHNGPGLPLLPGPARRQAEAEAKLRTVLPQVRFRGTPLQQALRALEMGGGIRIVADWEVMERCEVRADNPVDLSLDEVTVEQALDALLGYFRGAGPEPLQYTLYDGAIVVTADKDAGKYVYAGVYDLRDIDTGPPIPFDPTVQMRDVPPHLQRDEDLTRLIEGTVAPDSWYEGGPRKFPPVVGSTGGTVHAFSGRVVAVTTWQNHRQIEALVSQLRNPSR
jgi:hypothetical protein